MVTIKTFIEPVSVQLLQRSTWKRAIQDSLHGLERVSMAHINYIAKTSHCSKLKPSVDCSSNISILLPVATF